MRADDLFRGITRRSSMALATYMSGAIKEENMFRWGISQLLLLRKIQPINSSITEQRLNAFVKANLSNYPSGSLFVLRAKDESDLPDGYVFTYRMSNGSILRPYYFISDKGLALVKEKDIGSQE